MPDTYVELPNGSYVQIPAGASQDKLAQLRTKLSSQRDPLETGKGMENPPDTRFDPKNNAITQGPESQGAELMAHIAGHEHAPLTADEATKQMKQTTGAMASGYSIPLTAGIPGPGGKGSLIAQAAKGAGFGAGMGALEHGMVRAGRGEFPDPVGTLKAAGTGGLIGSVAGPVMAYPPVQEAIGKIPYLRKFLPEAEEQPFTPMGPTRVNKSQIQTELSPPMTPMGPTRMNRSDIPAMNAPAGPEGIRGAADLGKGRMVLTPEEAKTADLQYQQNRVLAHQRGMSYAGGRVPATGRSVPQRPMPIETEEYPGPREVVPLEKDEDEEP
jgi:hypothetical protein